MAPYCCACTAPFPPLCGGCNGGSIGLCWHCRYVALKELLEAVLLPSTLAICKCAAHTKHTDSFPLSTLFPLMLSLCYNKGLSKQKIDIGNQHACVTPLMVSGRVQRASLYSLKWLFPTLQNCHMVWTMCQKGGCVYTVEVGSLHTLRLKLVFQPLHKFLVNKI